ncbi:unnamed protein product [Mycena citricolor]|uniref:Uncharacterized protein n=1 Tax=Mycena citricolor TaxID=2018698 RepID=A0AAD2HWC0_9AGAR|nr:unnamed protein product [Mycena citricolor]
MLPTYLFGSSHAEGVETGGPVDTIIGNRRHFGSLPGYPCFFFISPQLLSRCTCSRPWETRYYFSKIHATPRSPRKLDLPAGLACYRSIPRCSDLGRPIFPGFLDFREHADRGSCPCFHLTARGRHGAPCTLPTTASPIQSDNSLTRGG